MKRQLFFILIVSLLAVSLAAGCAPQQRPAPDTTPAPQQRITPMPGAPDGTNNTAPDVDPQEESRRATRIANRIDDLEGVEDATVIVNGATAYVGINMDNNAQGRMTDALKQQVIDRAEASDQRLTRVYVTAEVDAVTRLRNYSRDIEGGRPISGFINQIEEIFRRPAPTVR